MFPFFRRKKTKLEILKESVSGVVQGALEYVPVDRLEDARDSLGEVLHSAAETAGGVKKQITVKAVKSAAKGAKHAHGVAQRAGEARESLTETLTQKTAQAGAALHGAKDTVLHTAANAGEGVHQVVQHAGEVAGSAAEKAASLKPAILKKKDKAHQGAKEVVAVLEVRRKDSEDDEFEVEIQEGGSKWLWIALGLLAGAVIAAFVVPASGRRNRAAIKDRLDKVSRDAATIGQIAGEKVADLGQRAGEVAGGAAEQVQDVVGNAAETVKSVASDAVGTVQETATNAKTAVSEKVADVKEAATDAVGSAGDRIDEAKTAAAEAAQQTEDEMRQDIAAASAAPTTVAIASATDIGFSEGDDTIIADRIRTELGQNEATRDVPSLNVESVGGIVTLRGPKLEEFEREAVEKVVLAVEGVREVHTEHILTDASEDEATFVG